MLSPPPYLAALTGVVEHTEYDYSLWDPFRRKRFAGEAIRDIPHGRGEMTWHRGGNYRRFRGMFDRGEMRDGQLWFGAEGESTYK